MEQILAGIDGLTTDFIGKKIIYFDETDSTNTQAKLKNTFPDGSVFIADTQTDGRGSRQRTWSSPKDSGIWLSILLKPDISFEKVSQITLVAGLAACKAIGGKIKWPNDIVIGSKKVCGILTEMSSINNKLNYVVCGIGINVNDKAFPDDIAHRATSLYLENGRKYSRKSIIAKLLNEFEYFYKLFLNKGLEAILDEYKKSCITLNRDVKVIFENKTVTGTAVDIDTDGRLILKYENGLIPVTSGEVSVRGIYDYI